MQPATTDQLDLWTSDFGRQYTDRNDAEIPGRADVWRELLAGLHLERVLEVGCNVGWNLEYIGRTTDAALYGVEAQRYAVERAHQQRPGHGVVRGTAFDLPFRDAWFDLVFTSGVLIHISSEDLPRALDEMYRASKRYLIAIEYDSPEEVAIPYRGHDAALWKRDHGAIWQRRFPSLRLLGRGFLGRDRGYDDCTYHVFEK